MTTATETSPPKVWTVEDLLAMPDDGVERWIINGKLRETPCHPQGPGAEPELFNVTQRMPEHPAMPGFAPGVAELFE